MTRNCFHLWPRSAQSCAHEKKFVAHAPRNVFCVQDSFCSWHLWRLALPTLCRHMGRFLAMQSFEWRFLVTIFLTCGQDAPCMFSFNVTFDGSNDSAYQHHCVLDEPVRFFVSFHCVLCGDFCHLHLSYSISERNDGWFCLSSV